MNEYENNARAGDRCDFLVTLANEFVKDRKVSVNNLFALENIYTLLLRKNIPASRKVIDSLGKYIEKYKSILELQKTEKCKQ